MLVFLCVAVIFWIGAYWELSVNNQSALRRATIPFLNAIFWPKVLVLLIYAAVEDSKQRYPSSGLDP
jgi:hypothetical protein